MIRSAYTATAPGKLVLVGEYAVLTGAPALVMAVRRRARASVSPAAPGRLRVCSNLLPEPFDLDPGRIGAEGTEFGEHPEFAWIPRLLVFVLGKTALPEIPALQLDLDTSDFFHMADGTMQKLGLGSSAALSTALCSAAAAYLGGQAGAVQWAPEAADLITAHRVFAGGRGSGIDVAAACHGGLLRFSMDSAAQALPWPESLHFRCVWSGASASTQDLVKRVMAWRKARPEAARVQFQRMAGVASEAVASVSSADVPALLAALARYGELMGTLGEAAKVDIFSRRHRRIQALAQRYGVAYKPSGAGGGDVGLLFHEDRQHLDRVAREIAGQGYPAVELQLDTRGLALD